MIFDWFIFAFIGVITGTVAGLLGLGGGLIIVPALLVVFSWQDIAEQHIMQLAVATSLMTITLTSLSSTFTHHKLGNVNWDSVLNLLPSLIIGGFTGAYIATIMASQYLQYCFAIYMILMAMAMWNLDLFTVNERSISTVPTFAVGGLVGGISALVGIGGGSLLVPYFTMMKQSIKRAIGTSSACGFPISVAAIVGFLFFGKEVNLNIAWQTGFIHWQAFLGIISTSIIFAVIGAKLSSHLPIIMLKRVFSFVMMVSAIYLIVR